MIVYLNREFLSKEEARISPDDRGFLFADGAYEVIRAYEGKLFQMAAHVRRLERSLAALQIAWPGAQELPAIAQALIQRNGLEKGDAALYVQVTRGVAARKHAFPPPGTCPTVYATASALQPSREKWARGVAVVLVPDIRWARCDIKSLALLPNVLASQQAKEQGAEEALFVRDGIVTEGAHTNFCAVLDGQLVTHPQGHQILSGITRGVVLDLCHRLGIPNREAPIRQADLPRASECLILGTTTEILPVVRVDDRQVGDGRPGPITQKLQAAFRTEVAASNGARAESGVVL